MTSPFSPLIGGFECGTVPAHDGEHNLLETTRHLPSQRMRQHYEIAKAHGMTTVRDGAQWGEGIDRRMSVAKRAGVQVIWDALHFHKMDKDEAWHLGVLIAESHLRVFGPDTDLWLCPLNEIETHAWMRGTGVQGAVDLWHAVRDGARSVLGDHARCVGSCVLNSVDGPWEGIDAIAEACDVIGINVYPHTVECCIADLLVAAHRRTEKPVMITETSFHVGHPEHRGTTAEWLEDVLCEVQDAQDMGVEYWGTCWYPLVSCPPWPDKNARPYWDHGLVNPDGLLDNDLSIALRGTIDA